MGETAAGVAKRVHGAGNFWKEVVSEESQAQLLSTTAGSEVDMRLQSVGWRLREMTEYSEL